MNRLSRPEASANVSYWRSRPRTTSATSAESSTCLLISASVRQAYDHARQLPAVVDDGTSSMSAWRNASYIDVHEYRSLKLAGDYAAAAEGFDAAIDA
jgi:hypothetical protein